MDKSQLSRAGECLFGPRWHSGLAAALSVDRRTIRRWAKGEWAVPDGAASDIDRLLNERLKEIRKLLT